MMKKNILISFLIGIAINLIGIIVGVFKQINYLKLSPAGYNLECPCSVYNTFILLSNDTFAAKCYIYIIPIISSIVCWNDYSLENCSIRKFFCGVKLYYAKGFAVTFLTLLFSLIISFAVFPAINPEISTGYFPLGYRGGVLFELYLKHPLIYCMIFCVLYSLYSGMFSTIGNAVYLLVEKKIWIPVCTFLINISVSRLLVFGELDTLQPSSLFIPMEIYMNVSTINYVEYFIILTCIICLILMMEFLYRKAIGFDKKK